MKYKTRYLYQFVSGTPSKPQGVCSGYFKTPDSARLYHQTKTGYIRRVRVPVDLKVDIYEG